MTNYETHGNAEYWQEYYGQLKGGKIIQDFASCSWVTKY